MTVKVTISTTTITGGTMYRTKFAAKMIRNDRHNENTHARLLSPYLNPAQLHVHVCSPLHSSIMLSTLYFVNQWSAKVAG